MTPTEIKTALDEADTVCRPCGCHNSSSLTITNCGLRALWNIRSEGNEMVKKQVSHDPKMVEAEEDLLIDFQFLVQDLINSRRISRTELAQKSGMSKARISQLLSAEANPTVRSFARLFHALDAKVMPKCLAERQAATPNQEF